MTHQEQPLRHVALPEASAWRALQALQCVIRLASVWIYICEVADLISDWVCPGIEKVQLPKD